MLGYSYTIGPLSYVPAHNVLCMAGKLCSGFSLQNSALRDPRLSQL